MKKWLLGGIIGAIVTLILGLFGHFIVKMPWAWAPFNFLNMGFCGLNKCSFFVSVLNWVLLIVIGIIIGWFIDKRST